LHLFRGLAGHRADIEIKAAFAGVAGEAPRHAAAHGRDRDIGAFAHVYVRLLVFRHPLFQHGLEGMHSAYRVDHARVARKRGVAHRPTHGDLHPERAHVRRAYLERGRLAQDRVVARDAVQHHVAGADAVTGDRATLEFVHRSFFRFADYAAEEKIAFELDALMADGFQRDERGSDPAFHGLRDES